MRLPLPAEQCAAREAGVDDYLGKPFDPAELMDRVHALLAPESTDRPMA